MGDVAMMRVRLKADGRIVEILPDGSCKPALIGHDEGRSDYDQ